MAHIYEETGQAFARIYRDNPRAMREVRDLVKRIEGTLPASGAATRETSLEVPPASADVAKAFTDLLLGIDNKLELILQAFNNQRSGRLRQRPSSG